MKSWGNGARIAMLNIQPAVLLGLMATGATFTIEHSTVPDGAKIVQSGMEMAASGDRVFYLLIEHESFSPMEAGDEVPVLASPTILRVEPETEAQ